jgi:hypothetical protein
MADQKLDPNAPLAGDALKAAQAKIKEAILAADEAIYKTAGDLPGKLSRAMAGVEDVATLGVLNETRRRIDESYRWNVANWETYKKIAWPAANAGTVDGQIMSAKQAEGVIYGISSNVRGVETAIQTVQDYAKGTIIWKSTGQVFINILSALAGVGKTLNDLGKAAGAIASGAAKTGESIGNWLPWIIGALVLGPLLLRSFAGYKKGGAGGAAEAAAAELESGRRAVGEGARKAWEGGKSLARRAASGGAISGAPRRRRSR